MRLDRDALEYLLAVAKDIGFESIEMETHEWVTDLPTVKITFRQHKQLLASKPAVSEPITKASELKVKPPDPMKTLDEE